MRLVCTLILLVTGSFNLFANPSQKISLRDEIGQMLLIGFEEKKINSQSLIVQEIEKNNLGGVILFDYDTPTNRYDRNIENPAQVKELNKNLQYYTHQANKKHHRSDLPLLISVDYEGGKVNRLKEAYGFPAIPSAAEIGKGSLEQAALNANIMASTLREAGFNLNFAPMLDVNVNIENPVIGKKDRSFSSDPDQVILYSRVYSQSFRRHQLQCAFKHFPGHGSSTKDSHLDFVDVSNTWQAEELRPYQQLINSPESCDVIMSAHIVNRQLDESGLPATLSHRMLTEILRHQLHFNGVIITDDMQMKAIIDNYSLEQALVLAINAGADMMIFGNNLTVGMQNPKQLIDIIEAKVHSGEIARQRIDEAYHRIQSLKKSIH